MTDALWWYCQDTPASASMLLSVSEKRTPSITDAMRFHFTTMEQAEYQAGIAIGRITEQGINFKSVISEVGENFSSELLSRSIEPLGESAATGVGFALTALSFINTLQRERLSRMPYFELKAALTEKYVQSILYPPHADPLDNVGRAMKYEQGRVEWQKYEAAMKSQKTEMTLRQR